MRNEKKRHWETVFSTKTDSQKSWFEEYPQTSIDLIRDLNIPKSASIIDVGGGDSRLVDVLLEDGYNNISVLDISAIALENAKKRLAEKSVKASWIVADILQFQPPQQYDCWHDRAVFHFITDKKDQALYIQKMVQALKKGGNLILASFSEKGPAKCSGLPVQRYSQKEMTDLLEPWFQKIECFEKIHQTPSGASQYFTYCSFFKKG